MPTTEPDAAERDEREPAGPLPEVSLVNPSQAPADASGSPAEGAPGPPDRGALDSHLVRGVAWTGTVRWLVQLVSWPVTLLTAKLLSPGDYGLLATIGVFTRFVALVTEGGFGTIIVSGAEMSPRHLRQLNALALLVALGAFLLSCGLAWPVAHFTRTPDAAWVVVAFSAMLVLDGAILVPNARLRRRMQFRELVLIEAARNITDICTTLGLAFMGWGYWALVGGALAGVVVQTVAILSLAATGFERPVLSELQSTLRACFHLVSRNMGEFLSTNSDRLIGGRVLGSAALGYYTFASTLAWAPAEKVSSMVMRVTPALFGRVRDDVVEVRRYLLNITEAVTFVTIPMFAGLALVADDAIGLVLGAKWAGMVAPLRLFCAAAALTELFIAVPHALQARGHFKPLAQNGIASLVLYPPAFLLLAMRFGPGGMALAWAVIGPALSARLLRILCADLEMPVRRYLQAVAPAATSAVVMAGAVLAVRAALVGAGAPTAVRFAASVAVGALSYVLAAWTLHNARVRAVLDFARRQRAAMRGGA
jgi:PST family polysaccharide transporter